MLNNQSKQTRPSAGTSDGLLASAVYVDLVSGLKKQVLDLRRNNYILAAIAAICLISLILSLPLKKRVPYFFEVDTVSGRVGLTNRVAEELKVSDKNIAFFLRLWAARLVTINAATLKDGMPSAYRWTRGGGQTEMDRWTDETDKTAERIGKTPGLTRDLLGAPVISFNEDRNIAFIDLTWIEKVHGVEQNRKRKLLTVEFGLIPPSNKRSDEEPDDPDNPLRIAITHFTITEVNAK